MISKIRKILLYIIASTGLYSVGKYINRRKLFLIGYHGVDNKIDNNNFLYHDLIMSADAFESQIETLLQNGHTFIDPEEIRDSKLVSVSLPTVIYFDDAYKDLLDHALPALNKRGIKPIIFVPTDLIDGKVNMWTHAERYYLREKGFDTKTIEERIKGLKRLPHRERDKALQSNKHVYNLNLFLSWEDLAHLYRNDLALLGSHGVTHTRLNELSKNEVIKEICESKRIIEENIPGKILSFSFPGGRMVEGVEEYLKDAGYEFAVSTVSGVNSLPIKSSHRFRLKKVAPKPGESIMMFKARLYFSFLFK